MGRRPFVLGWLALVGCKSHEKPNPDDGTPVDSGLTDTDTHTTDTQVTDTQVTDTQTGSTPSEPSRLEVTCAATDNVLRYQCTVVVEPAQPFQLTYVRSDGLSIARLVATDDPVVPMYFLAPNQDYDVEVHATAWPDDLAGTTVTTGSVPASVESHLDMTGASTMGMIGTNLPCSSAAVAVAYDTTTGDLLWYQLLDQGGTLGPNDMVVFTDDHTVLGESEGDVIEVDLMGSDLVRLNDLDNALGVNVGGLFGNFHHDIAKHDGVYYVMYQDPGGRDTLDDLILFDGTGTELARWYAEDHLALPSDWSGDFLHMNAVYVDPNGDILLSFHTQNTIARFDGDWTSPTFGEQQWILAGTSSGDLGNSIDTDWSGVGAPSSFNGQHSLFVRPDGQLELLDNNNGRALLIDLDEAAGTAAVIGEYPTHEDRCNPQGTARSTLAGNPVVGCLGDWIREYDLASSDLLWEAEVQCPGGGGGGFLGGATRWYPLDGW